MKADLHVHSYYSDGTCSPQEILRLARQKRLLILVLLITTPLPAWMNSNVFLIPRRSI